MGNITGTGLSDCQASDAAPKIEVALLTGGADRPYAFGLATELMAKGTAMDVIGGDDIDFPEFRNQPGVRFLNLRGDQRPDASFTRKALRVLAYYFRLIHYALKSKPRLFHILWNNKFEWFDRTLLMLYYRLLGKKIVLTVHNVNAGKRDSRDTVLNRLTLRTQYHLVDHIFVHSAKMKKDLIEEFGVQDAKVTVIPFGINNAVPITSLTSEGARQQLGIGANEKTLLFFGNIAPYKGLEYLISALQKIVTWRRDYRLIIAGRPKNCPRYWEEIQQAIQEDVQRGRILLREDYILDEDTEIYFKAADVLVLPYRYIYQSGVIFLGYSFGLPVLAADVGSLKEEIIEGKTGFVFRPEDPRDLAETIERYFASELFADLDSRRQEIREYAAERHSWDEVGHITTKIYANLLYGPEDLPSRDTSKASFDMKSLS